MKIAVNYWNNMIIKDNTGEKHIFTEDEFREIGKAVYSWVQKKKAGYYIY